MAVKSIEVASRELRRLVGAGVGGSFLKTLTEPITNSDSALKTATGVSHAAGLVDQLLSIEQNHQVNTTALRDAVKSARKRQIVIELYRNKHEKMKARTCRIIDAGPGMSSEELSTNFAVYASAKAKGQKTRSLFGRGALEVLLYHDDSVIYSVKDGVLSRCRLFWDGQKKPTCEIDELGQNNEKLLRAHNLPDAIRSAGTVVQFTLKEGTHIPQTADIAERITSFYMLRLIASDPNTELVLKQYRAEGDSTDILRYSFPVGTVLGRFSDILDLGPDGTLPVDIFVARSDEPLKADAFFAERRENGLLIVDDNDAVLDLTLTPGYDNDPFLKHIFGLVRITGIRDVLERKLDSDDPVAVVTETRDGFNKKHDISKKLFALLEKHLKPICEKERQRQQKGGGNRSEKLAKRIREALKALNQFATEETEVEEGGGKSLVVKDVPIWFSVNSVSLVVDQPRRVTALVNPGKVNKGEVILFESDNPEIQVEPDAETVGAKGKKPTQEIPLTITCRVKGQTGKVTAVTIDKNGDEYTATLKIDDVTDPPPVYIPEDIEFARPHFIGSPHRVNNATLLVNLEAFAGMPQISFLLESKTGDVTLGADGGESIDIKVSKEDLVGGAGSLARVLVRFGGTGWGQHAKLCARAKRKDGTKAHAQCKLRFERPKGNDRFSDFIYEPFERNVLAQASGDKIFVNAGYSVHKTIFGKTQEDFEHSLETKEIAQMRAAQVVVEAAVYDAAFARWQKGGEAGLDIDPDDPITSIRSYVEESRIRLEPRVVKALLPTV